MIFAVLIAFLISPMAFAEDDGDGSLFAGKQLVLAAQNFIDCGGSAEAEEFWRLLTSSGTDALEQLWVFLDEKSNTEVQIVRELWRKVLLLELEKEEKGRVVNMREYDNVRAEVISWMRRAERLFWVNDVTTKRNQELGATMN
jgi:hypothetical protein